MGPNTRINAGNGHNVSRQVLDFRMRFAILAHLEIVRSSKMLAPWKG
jgi:hypothetical protein